MVFTTASTHSVDDQSFLPSCPWLISLNLRISQLFVYTKVKKKFATRERSLRKVAFPADMYMPQTFDSRAFLRRQYTRWKPKVKEENVQLIRRNGNSFLSVKRTNYHPKFLTKLTLLPSFLQSNESKILFLSRDFYDAQIIRHFIGQ